MILRDAGPDDAATIDRIFRASFTQTFAHLYAREDLDAFLSTFTDERWQRELASARFAFRLAERDGEAVGYCKVGPMDLPLDDPDPGAVELYHLYLLDSAKGTGLADRLVDWALDAARQLGGATLYLSVFVDNHRARRFYDRHGFTEVGPYAFMVGNHEDHDIIMKRPL